MSTVFDQLQSFARSLLRTEGGQTPAEKTPKFSFCEVPSPIPSDLKRPNSFAQFSSDHALFSCLLFYEIMLQCCQVTLSLSGTRFPSNRCRLVAPGRGVAGRTQRRHDARRVSRYTASCSARSRDSGSGRDVETAAESLVEAVPPESHLSLFFSWHFKTCRFRTALSWLQNNKQEIEFQHQSEKNGQIEHQMHFLRIKFSLFSSAKFRRDNFNSFSLLMQISRQRQLHIRDSGPSHSGCVRRASRPCPSRVTHGPAQDLYT